MPWRETTPMEQRLELVREYESGMFTMTELAAAYGVSRKTGYKWLAQYEAAGARGLQDRSRRPHHHPQAIDAALVEAILAIRGRHPRWGPKKLLAVARRRASGRRCPSRPRGAR
jgi:transposase-like protein